MFRKLLTISFLLLVGSQFMWANLFDTIRYKNGIRKEVGYSENSLVNGVRKLYSKRGELLESHHFKGNVGTLISYYSDTIKASVLKGVIQSIDENGSYKITVPIDAEFYGFYKGTTKKRYEIKIASEFVLDFKETYEHFNVIFDDFVLLYKRRLMNGLVGSTIIYYKSDGIHIESQVIIGALEKGNRYIASYPGGQVKAEGYIKKIRSTDYYVGTWAFHYPNGLIQSVEKYYNGEETGKQYIKYGTKIDTAYFYYNDPSVRVDSTSNEKDKDKDISNLLKAIVIFPSPKDVFHRTDTIQTYYMGRKKRSIYDEKKKAFIFKSGLGKDDAFPFSGLYEEFYADGNRKIRGYLSKPPRNEISQQEALNQLNQCIYLPTKHTVVFQGDPFNKQIGMWYYFNTEGELIDMKEFRLCGQLREKKQPTKKMIEKEASKYKMKGKDYEFQDAINDNE
jgi:hypothetical protein